MGSRLWHNQYLDAFGEEMTVTRGYSDARCAEAYIAVNVYTDADKLSDRDNVG
jgi:hypothetical protein